MPDKDRKATVLAAINGLGPGVDREEIFEGDPAFFHAVAQWVARTGASEEHAAIFVALARYGFQRCTPETLRWLRGAEEGRFSASSDATSAWLSRWARSFYGDRGPVVQ